jgi:hypothetical protein
LVSSGAGSLEVVIEADPQFWPRARLTGLKAWLKSG